MVDAGLTKADVRGLARSLGLDLWDKPAMACLSSRFPHGVRISPERIQQVEGVEVGLRSLGFRQLRARFHGQTVRIELGSDELIKAVEPQTRQAIVDLGKLHGFRYVALDLAGYRQGSLNPE